MSDENLDGLSELANVLAIKRSGYFQFENPETGAVALFPDVKVFPVGSREQIRLEDSWESRAIEMHEAQTPVVLADKPLENVLAERLTVRGN